MNDQKALYKMHADFCKFMSNPKRIEIIFQLEGRELCVNGLSEAMDVKVPNISQHLALMRENGVLSVRRDGNRMYYSITNPKTLLACKIMREAMMEEMENQYHLIHKENNQ